MSLTEFYKLSIEIYDLELHFVENKSDPTIGHFKILEQYNSKLNQDRLLQDLIYLI